MESIQHPVKPLTSLILQLERLCNDFNTGLLQCITLVNCVINNIRRYQQQHLPRKYDRQNSRGHEKSQFR